MVRLLKRAVVLGLAAALLLCFAAPCRAATFYAVSDFEKYTESGAPFYWARDDLKLVVAAELMRGFPPEGPEEKAYVFDGTGEVACRTFGPFRPEATITRAEFATILARVLDLEGKDFGASPFGDVKVQSWYGPNVVRLVEAGVIDPADYGSRFAPDGPITRLEVAVWAARAAVKAGAKAEPGEVRFADFDPASKHAGEVAEAVALGILKGYPDGTFRPQGTANRAEAAAMLVRMLKHAPLYPGLDREEARRLMNETWALLTELQKSVRIRPQAYWANPKGNGGPHPDWPAALAAFQSRAKGLLTEYHLWPRAHPAGFGALNGLASRDEEGPRGDFASLENGSFGLLDGALQRWNQGPNGVPFGVPMWYRYGEITRVAELVGRGPVAEAAAYGKARIKYDDGADLPIFGGAESESPVFRAVFVKQGGAWRVAAIWVDSRGPWLRRIGFAD
ncbi:MAG: S-layer homology domain-containing protein [Moorellales bacterium]